MIPIPTNIPWRAIGAVVLAAGLFAAGWAANGWRKDAEIDRMNANLARERQGQALAQVKAVDAARLEEQRRTAAQTEIANAATENAARAQSAADAANVSAGRLRATVAALLAERDRADNPAPAAGGSSADDAGVLLAGLLEKSVERNRQLAAYADTLRISGEACERSYDALMKPRER